MEPGLLAIGCFNILLGRRGTPLPPVLLGQSIQGNVVARFVVVEYSVQVGYG
jgi:hypothetical protein